MGGGKRFFLLAASYLAPQGVSAPPNRSATPLRPGLARSLGAPRDRDGLSLLHERGGEPFRELTGPSVAFGHTPAAIRDALIDEERAEFERAYRDAMAEATDPST